jgi:hypothetical protein
MKKNLNLQIIPALIFIFCFSIFSAPSRENITSGGKSYCQTTTPNITTLTVTIVKIDLPEKTITLKDKDGKIYVFVLDSNSTIDLSQYKVGQTLTATISTTIINNKGGGTTKNYDLIKLH